MLTPSLVSVYQQYKEDTDAVASWLASTGKSRGYPANLLSGASHATGPEPTTGPERPKRLKGKARSQAKAAAEQTQDSSSRPDYTIAIKDFVPLAEFLATRKNPIVSVPLSFANTLNRVISTRSGFRSQLAEAGDSPDHSADSKHSYFVSVLEKVREVLTPRLSPASRNPAKPPSPSVPVGEVGGRFAGLSIDEPSEQFLNAPDIERPMPVKDDNATYVAEPLQDPVEEFFAYSLMMDDLAMIRARIGWIWTSHGKGHLELAAAAIATNTACDLARNLMSDMTPIFKAQGGAIWIAQEFYSARCLVAGFTPDEIIDSSSKFNDETYDIATDTYMLTFIMLQSFLGMLHPHNLPVCKDAELGIYDPTRDWSKMSQRERFQQDEDLLIESLTELIMVIRCFPNYPVHDEFLRGMQELDRTREVPMYLAFAAQIYLDIHHILREKVCSGHKMCMSHLELMDEDLALQMDFHANLHTEKDFAPVDKTMVELRKRIKWVQDDHLHDTKVEVASKAGRMCTAPRHRILKYSPVISGLILYHFRAAIYKLGLSVASAWGSITTSMHLYSALKQENVLSAHDLYTESWSDMNVVEPILGCDSFYVGSEIPENPRGYVKQLALQMGISAAAFSKGNNKRLLTREKMISKGGARLLKADRAPVSDMFFGRYVENTGQVDWTPEHVDRVLSRALHVEVEEDSEDGSILLGQIVDREKLRQRKKNIVSGPAGKKGTAATAARMPPEQLIRSLTLVLQMESLTMAFSYMALHRASWSILHEVRDACDPLMAEVFVSSDTIRDDHVPSVVIRIFNSLLEGDDRLFVKAGEVVKDQLGRGQGAKALHRLILMGFKVSRLSDKSSPSSQKPGTFFLA